MTTPLDPIAKLEALAACRTSRTDRLESAVHALLARLADLVEVGDSASYLGCELSRECVRTNVGSVEFWAFGDDERSCTIDEAVNSTGYHCGDFGAAYRGPTRGELIRFARNARQFVELFAARLEAEGAKIDSAIASATDAIGAIS